MLCTCGFRYATQKEWIDRVKVHILSEEPPNTAPICAHDGAFWSSGPPRLLDQRQRTSSAAQRPVALVSPEADRVAAERSLELQQQLSMAVARPPASSLGIPASTGQAEQTHLEFTSRLARQLHIIGTYRQLVTVFSAADQSGSPTAVDVRAAAFADELLEAMLFSYRVASHSASVPRERPVRRPAPLLPLAPQVEPARLEAAGHGNLAAPMPASSALSEHALREAAGATGGLALRASTDCPPLTPTGARKSVTLGGLSHAPLEPISTSPAESPHSFGKLSLRHTLTIFRAVSFGRLTRKTSPESNVKPSVAGGATKRAQFQKPAMEKNKWTRHGLAFEACLLQLLVQWDRPKAVNEVLNTPQLGVERTEEKLRRALHAALARGNDTIASMILHHTDERSSLSSSLTSDKLISQIDLACLYDVPAASGGGALLSGDAFGLLSQIRERREERLAKSHLRCASTPHRPHLP